MGATEKRKSYDFVDFSIISVSYGDLLIFYCSSFFKPFSSVLVLLVLRRSTEDTHAVPKTEPTEMGTIAPRKRRDGSTGYQAQLLIKRAGKIVQENMTFDRRQAASAWLEKREKELAKPGALERLEAPDPTLTAVIDRYTDESIKKIGRTKAQVLRSIKNHDIANKRCSEITSTDVVAFANELIVNVAPSTVGNYLSHLAAVFAITRPAWAYSLDQTAMKDAFVLAKRLGIASKSRERDRRPPLEELDKIMEYFGERLNRRPSSIPMQKVIGFAIFSTRRLEEITRISWKDLDVEGSRVLVRDMKNPGEKVGNDVWSDLPPEALQIILSMPKRHDEIFPFCGGTVGADFTRACQFLEIIDLHLHDLRHDGISRLFEVGRNIPQGAAVSGHRSWSSLKVVLHCY
jgi:integrase